MAFIIISLNYMNFPFTKYSKFYYIFSGMLIIGAVVSLAVFGLKFGIEFTGGSAMEVEFTQKRPSNEEISKSLAALDLGDITIQSTGQMGVIVKLKGIDETQHQQVISNLSALSPLEEKNFQYIGPSVGQDLKNKTIIAIVVSLLAITVYIAFAFRKVSRPVASWKYGITSLIALFHDIIIPLGVFSLLGKFYHAEITIPIIAALLTIIGFSVHDTIVIFDRIRENILRRGMDSFAKTVDASLRQTVGRSVSTVATVLLVMASLFFFGGETLKYFSLALIVGVASGAYSSIFIASPLLVTWQRWDEKRHKS